MTELAAAAIAFFVLHRGVAGTRVRDALVERIGTKAFRALFALATLLVLIWLWLAFDAARASAANTRLYPVIAGLRPVQLVLQFVAILLIVTGVTTRNPTIVGGGAAVRDQNVVRGVLRITRHPFMWGVSLLALGHMLVAPTAANGIFFGVLLLVASTGTLSIDAKRRRALGVDWGPFAEKTSNLPFGAIFAGRQSLRLGEIGLWRVLVAIAVYAALVLLHPALFGAQAVALPHFD